MAIDLSRLSIAELEQLINDAEKMIRKQQRAQRNEVMQKVREMAASVGVAIEVVGDKKSRTKTKSAPKYRNPANPQQTWTGRGPKPAWFKEAIAAGRSLESMSV